MASMALSSQIPATNPRKRSVEDAIRDALKAARRPWRVEIELSRTSAERWFIKLLDQTTGTRRTIFVNGQRAQSPRSIRERVLGVISAESAASGSLPTALVAQDERIAGRG